MQGQNMRRVLMPAYLARFRCLGAACEDNCCEAGWNIPIDASTFARYRDLDHPMGSALRASMPANPIDKTTPEDFARIRLDDRGCCPFLSDRLCGIQQTLGEAYISNVCVSYPRRTNIVEGDLERAATVSCPEIARLALLDADGMRLTTIEEPSSTRTVVGAVFDSSDLQAGLLLSQAKVIRQHSVRLLTVRSGTIQARVVALGLYLKRIGKALDPSAVDEAFHLYERSLVEVDEELRAIAPPRALQLEMLRELTVERFATGRVLPSGRYDQLVDRVARGLRLRRTAQAGEDSIAAYDMAHEGIVRAYLDRRPHLLENFLVNHVYSTSFPFSGGRKPFDEYVLMSVRFALVKMLLVGAAACEGRLTDDLVIETIQPFERVVSHDPSFLRHMLQLLKRSHAATMPFLTALVL